MNLFIITSLAASGKTTLVDYVTEEFYLYKLKTCTTRPVRPEEKGDEYHFIPREDFAVMMSHNKFVEYASVYDNYYGLTKEEVENNKDKNCIVILDVQGTETMMKLYPEATPIFLLPAPIPVIQRRLEKRKTSDADVKRRMEEVTNEIIASEKYEYRVKYGSLIDMKEELFMIISEKIVDSLV